MSAKKKYTYDGKTMYLKDWATKAGISTQALRQRLYIGWDFGRAVSTPNTRYQYELDGRRYSMEELTIMNGTVKKDTMWQRIHNWGMSVKEAVDTPNRHIRTAKSTSCRLDCFRCPYTDCIQK